MRVNLQCPYTEKDQAKALGARWDAARKVWYVIDPERLENFARWMPNYIKAGECKPKQKNPKQAFVTIGAHYVEADHPAGLLPWEDEDDAESIRILRSI